MKKKIDVIIRWGLTIFLVLLGVLGAMPSNVFSGLILLIGAIIINPLLDLKISQYKIKNWIRYLLMVILFIISMVIYQPSNIDLYENQPNYSSELEETKTENPPKPTVLEDNLPTESFFSKSGTGDDIVTGLIVENYSYLKVTANSANRHFAIKAHYDNTYDLLINTTSSYNGGSTLLYPNREYTLEITGTGNWTVEAFKLGTSSTDKFSANGDYVSPIFICSSDVYEINAPGGGHFAVKGYHDAGGYDLLVNTTDTYSGKVMLKQKGELCFFEVTGEREFTITSSN